jgi:CO dehydrogenase maturation factor
MIIGCMGKGGSGKSTLTTLLVKYLDEIGKNTLAIDADHNMDLTFNLRGGTENLPFIGQGLNDLLRVCGLEEGQKYASVFEQTDIPSLSFSSTKDPFSLQYGHQLSDNTTLMVSGPHTESILHGSHCSHILATPLKVYLPLLQLNQNDCVVIDEKAGSDGAGAGISTGMDVACIAVEPTRHGVKAATQISELLSFYKTPHIFVGNKVLGEEDEQFLEESLPKKPSAYLRQCIETRNVQLTDEVRQTLQRLLEELRSLNNSDRLVRTKEKFKRNKEYNTPE